MHHPAKKICTTLFSCVLAAALFLTPAPERANAWEDSTAGGAPAEVVPGTGTHPATPERGEGEEDIAFAELAEAFRDHCVRVYIHGKSHEGNTPTVGEFGEDIRYERPTPVGGYWWDERHVVIADPVLQDYYIRSIEISLPGSEKRYPARVAGRFLKLEAILLKVEPDADGTLPEAVPLQFVDGDVEEAITLSYGWASGEWRVSADSGLGTSSLSDSGRETADLGGQGVLVSADGEALGLSFGDEVLVNGEEAYWSGAGLGGSPFYAAEDREKADEALRAQLSGTVLEASFRIRIKVEDEEEEEDWALEMDDGLLGDGAAEVRAAALVVGEHHLLVPVSLPPAGIARIEDIAVVAPDGTTLQAEFVGALREYMAVLLETREALPVDNLPTGFADLNPLGKATAADNEDGPGHSGYIQRWRVDYGLGRRREVGDYDRWIGTFRGYRDDPVVLTRTNEGDGALAFDREGRLVAVALTPRLLRSGVDGIGSASAGFRPLAFVSRRLRAEDAFDSALRPVAEEQGQRLIDLGVEFQALDSNTARLFHAARETRGGKIGLLVTHVYPGTMADKMGLREHDVLLRLFVEGRNEPMELRSSGYSFGFDIDMSSEAFQNLMRYLPPPWPGRDNVVSTLLTGAGAGRKAALEYLRDGTLERAEFDTGYFEPDYRNARRERFPLLGITVKPITYEVARYFSRPENTGVIVSRVEEGSKGSVAGLHHYLLITHVDGMPVSGIEDFRTRVEPFESGDSRSVELTVEGFGKTRLVKIE